MTATAEVERQTDSPDAVLGYLAEVLATVGGLARTTGRVDDATRIDRIVRRTVDRQLGAAGLDQLAPKAAAGQARRLAYAADPHSAVKRARNARTARRVSLRPAPDTMCWLTALLPVEDGVRAYAALTRHTDAVKSAGDERSRGQIMADTTGERPRPRASRVEGRDVRAGQGRPAAPGRDFHPHRT